jgi:hypothetical protein
MSKIKYFSGDEELAGAFMGSREQHLAIGGVVTKHNRVSASQCMIGIAKDGSRQPITRRIEYKSNPSKHKCNARCMSATGHVCECECGGKNHGLHAK